MKRSRQQRTASPNVHRLAAGAQLVLSDSDTMILIVRGACAVRAATKSSVRVEAGSFLLQQGANRAPFDRRIARALELLRAEPAKAWTVTRLARTVGLSRAAFARRFAAVCGRTPGRLLVELRLALAASLLERTDDSLAELATRVGYTSEFAFSRAFKRLHGVAPGTFRRQFQGCRSAALALAA